MDLYNESLYDLSKPHYAYSFVLPVEENFDTIFHLKWFRENFYLSFVSVTIYVIVILLLKRFMQNRPRIELRRAAIVWNFSLALFSFFVVLRFLPDVAYDVLMYGYKYTLCDASFVFTNPVVGFWGILYLHSKIVELGDTVFLVLRKRQLTVLHMYHHISVPIMSWYMICRQIGPARWVPLVNGGVHCFMYTYFGLKVLGVRLPMWVSVSLTATQISQMLYGGYCISVLREVVNSGGKCSISFDQLIPSLVLVVSYTTLFLNFFYHSYLKNSFWSEQPRVCYAKCREFVSNFNSVFKRYVKEEELENDKKVQ